MWVYLARGNFNLYTAYSHPTKVVLGQSDIFAVQDMQNFLSFKNKDTYKLFAYNSYI